jgi:hypothetical protein
MIFGPSGCGVESSCFNGFSERNFEPPKSGRFVRSSKNDIWEQLETTADRLEIQGVKNPPPPAFLYISTAQPTHDFLPDFGGHQFVRPFDAKFFHIACERFGVDVQFFGQRFFAFEGFHARFVFAGCRWWGQTARAWIKVVQVYIFQEKNCLFSLEKTCFGFKSLKPRRPFACALTPA